MTETNGPDPDPGFTPGDADDADPVKDVIDEVVDPLGDVGDAELRRMQDIDQNWVVRDFVADPVRLDWQDKLEDELGDDPEAHELAVAGCGKGCAVGLGLVVLIVTVVGVVFLVLGRLSDGPGPTASGADPAARAPEVVGIVPPPVGEEVLPILPGPWRIVNEELTVDPSGSCTTPIRVAETVVDEGTFTELDGGAALRASSGDPDEAALTFRLVAAGPEQRTYVSTFMGATYRLVFDASGHLTGEITSGCLLERRIEGFSVLDEDGEPRPDLPPVTPDEERGPSLDAGEVVGIDATCPAEWLPAGLQVPTVEFTAGSADDGAPACIGTTSDMGVADVRSLLRLEAARLDLQVVDDTETRVVLGCRGDVGAIRVDLATVEDGTRVTVSEDPDGCP